MTKEEILKECERNWETSHPMHRTLLAYDRRPNEYAYKLRWNQETGYYEMNGLTDLTYEDMLEVLGAGPSAIPYFSIDSFFNARTNYENYLPTRDNTIMNQGATTRITQVYRAFGLPAQWVSKLEVLCFNKGIVQGFDGQGLCSECKRLKRIIGVINIELLSAMNSFTIDYARSFQNCIELRNVKIQGARVNVSFADSPKIDYESLRYLLDNSSGRNFSVIVHPATYSYIMGESTPPSEVGGTEKQWAEMLLDSKEKGISFATIN